MPGPVFLSVPESCSAGEVPADVRGAYTFAAPSIRTRPHPQELREVMQALVGAKRPLIIAGNEVGAQRAAAQVGELADRLGVPVVTEEAFAITAVNCPNDHPLYHGPFRAELEVVRDADLVVALGSRAFLEYTFPAQPYIGKGVRFIQVGADIGEFGKIYPVERTLLCAIDLALDEMCTLAREGLVPEKQALAQRRARAAHGEQRVAPHAPPVPRLASGRQTPRLADLIDALHQVLPADGVIVGQSVLSKGPLHRRLPLGGDRLYFGTAGGGLGWGVGAAMGVQLGMPTRRVAAFLGDGATLYSIQGLWTAAHMKLPVVFIVVNNGGYMAVRKGLGEFGGSSVQQGVFPGCSIAEPAVDFCSIARGFGVKAAAVRERDGLVEGLRQAFDTDGPSLLEVSVHPDDYF
jgi:benzoylformate decarboxylase